jgi:hypothetical protein
MIFTSCETTASPALVPSQFPQVHDHRSWMHALDHVFGDQDRSLLAGDRRRGDDDVVLGHDLGHELALLLVELLAELLGVAALVLGGFGLEFHFDELAAETLHLLLHRGADVVGLHHGAQALGGRNRLQTRNPCSHHEHARGGDRARRGHEHREHAREFVRGDQHGLVAGHRRHGGEHVHALRAGDAREHFQGKQDGAGLRQFTDLLALGERLAHADHELALLELLQVGLSLIGVGAVGADLNDDVGGREDLVALRDLRASLGIFVVGESGRETGPGLDDHTGSKPRQGGDGRRDQPHAGLTRERLLGNTDYDRFAFSHRIAPILLSNGVTTPLYMKYEGVVKSDYFSMGIDIRIRTKSYVCGSVFRNTNMIGGDKKEKKTRGKVFETARSDIARPAPRRAREALRAPQNGIKSAAVAEPSRRYRPPTPPPGCAGP